MACDQAPGIILGFAKPFGGGDHVCKADGIFGLGISGEDHPL